MPSYNTNFELSIEDLSLIEGALTRKKAALAAERLDASDEDAVTSLDAEIREIAGLLGRLHNQKVFYRPKRGVYVG
ncbi:MAG: hypothetical protein AAF618_14205, partial [Pseudomonadota bacterium]